MAVGEQVLYAVGGHFFPLAGDVVLHVAGAGLVVVGLAQVVQQGTDGEGLLAVAFGEEGVVQRMVNVQAVHTQAPFTRAVEAGGRRGGEEIRLLVQPVQQLFAAGAGDVLVPDGKKLFAVSHLTAPDRRGCP